MCQWNWLSLNEKKKEKTNNKISKIKNNFFSNAWLKKKLLNNNLKTICIYENFN